MSLGLYLGVPVSGGSSDVSLLGLYPGATAAYALNRLSDDYLGPAIKVRRSSDNAELDIYFDSHGNANQAQLLNFVGSSSSYIKTWYDQSGNDNHAVQSIEASQPAIVSNGSAITAANGLLGNNYDGSDDYHPANSIASILSGVDQTMTIFTVAKTNNLALSNKVVAGFARSTDNITLCWVGGTSSEMTLDERDDANVGISLASGTLTSNITLITGFTNGNSRAVYGNGNELMTETTDLGQKTLDTFSIARVSRNSPAGYWSGSIHCVIVYPNDQRNNRIAIENALNSFWQAY